MEQCFADSFIAQLFGAAGIIFITACALCMAALAITALKDAFR